MRNIVCVILMLMFISTGCADVKEAYEEQVEVQIETVQECKVSDSSAIAEDFDLFDLSMNLQIDDLALADMEIMFPNETVCYVYFSMPKDTELYAYRAKDITINDVSYDLEFLNVDGYYQKYKLSDFNVIVTENNLYEISEIHYFNEKDIEDNYTYNVAQNVTAVFDAEKFYFEQEHIYAITLKGQCFESIYQFNKENNVFVDLWSKTIGDMEQLDEDRRSFFYFAFNCYDTEKGIRFVPEDILELEVKFNRLVYEYQGNKKEDAENIEPDGKEITQIIKPDTVHVTGTNEKRSNKCLYEYDTINKLSEADLSKNVGAANAAILNQAAKQYDWAVQFGASEGYPHKSNEGGIWWNHQYDINYTKIEDFEAINIKYRYEGKTVSTGVNSLIKENTVEVKEEDPDNPSSLDEKKHDWYVIWQDEELNLLEKLVKSVCLIIKPLILILVIILLIIIAVKFRKSRYYPLTNKLLEKKLKDKLDEN